MCYFHKSKLNIENLKQSLATLFYSQPRQTRVNYILYKIHLFVNYVYYTYTIVFFIYTCVYKLKYILWKSVKCQSIQIQIEERYWNLILKIQNICLPIINYILDDNLFQNVLNMHFYNFSQFLNANMITFIRHCISAYNNQ